MHCQDWVSRLHRQLQLGERLPPLTGRLPGALPCVQADPTLHRHVLSHGIPPFFALPWFITWFAHNVDSQVGAAAGRLSRGFPSLFCGGRGLLPLGRC